MTLKDTIACTAIVTIGMIPFICLQQDADRIDKEEQHSKAHPIVHMEEIIALKNYVKHTENLDGSLHGGMAFGFGSVNGSIKGRKYDDLCYAFYSKDENGDIHYHEINANNVTLRFGEVPQFITSSVLRYDGYFGEEQEFKAHQQKQVIVIPEDKFDHYIGTISAQNVGM